MNKYQKAFATIKDAIDYAFNGVGKAPHSHDIYDSMGLLKGAVWRTVKIPYNIDAEGTKYCGECGELIYFCDNYCSRCGYQIDWEEENG